MKEWGKTLTVGMKNKKEWRNLAKTICLPLGDINSLVKESKKKIMADLRIKFSIRTAETEENKTYKGQEMKRSEAAQKTEEKK